MFKRVYKNFLAGFGRALGYIAAIVLLSVVLKMFNVQVNLDQLPPSIEGEILSTLVSDDSQAAGFDPYH